MRLPKIVWTIIIIVIIIIGFVIFKVNVKGEVGSAGVGVNVTQDLVK